MFIFNPGCFPWAPPSGCCRPTCWPSARDWGFLCEHSCHRSVQLRQSPEVCGSCHPMQQQGSYHSWLDSFKLSTCDVSSKRSDFLWGHSLLTWTLQVLHLSLWSFGVISFEKISLPESTVHWFDVVSLGPWGLASAWNKEQRGPMGCDGWSLHLQGPRRGTYHERYLWKTSSVS